MRVGRATNRCCARRMALSTSCLRWMPRIFMPTACWNRSGTRRAYPAWIGQRGRLNGLLTAHELKHAGRSRGMRGVGFRGSVKSTLPTARTVGHASSRCASSRGDGGMPKGFNMQCAAGKTAARLVAGEGWGPKARRGGSAVPIAFRRAGGRRPDRSIYRLRDPVPPLAIAWLRRASASTSAPRAAN